MPGVRPGLFVRRRRRRAGDLRDPDLRFHRGRRRVDCRGDLSAAVLIALGTWQLERREWKEALIAELDRKLAAPPADLPLRKNWPQLNAERDEFRRVKFPAEFLPDQEALVYSSGSSLRPDVIGPGYWVFSPARVTGGSLVVVNRGFVPEG